MAFFLHLDAIPKNKTWHKAYTHILQHGIHVLCTINQQDDRRQCSTTTSHTATTFQCDNLDVQKIHRALLWGLLSTSLINKLDRCSLDRYRCSNKDRPDKEGALPIQRPSRIALLMHRMLYSKVWLLSNNNFYYNNNYNSLWKRRCNTRILCDGGKIILISG